MPRSGDVNGDEVRSPSPWILVATFCQAAIIEANTGNLSVIRVLDTLPLFGATKEMQQPIPVQLTMALLLKSGEMNGQYNIKVRCNSPSRTQTQGPEIPFYFEAGDRGVQVVLPIGLFANEPGVYWFDVLLEPDTILTRVPLRVIYQQIQLPPGMVVPPPPGTP
jgi:hypothetical protein